MDFAFQTHIDTHSESKIKHNTKKTKNKKTNGTLKKKKSHFGNSCVIVLLCASGPTNVTMLYILPFSKARNDKGKNQTT